MTDPTHNEKKAANTQRKSLSYKFQRLRERLREAVRTGELAGKLPGERVLAERFDCNAKTLSKALTDLAAEGLLERSVGRGTYVKGHGPRPEKSAWLIVLSPEDGDADYIVRRLSTCGVELEVVRGMPTRRPSYLAQFLGVVSFWRALPADLVRELLVRGISVVAVDHEPEAYAVNSVMVDRAGGAVRAARELIAMGHTKIAILEREGMPEMTPAIQAVAKLLGHVEIEVYKCAELANMARSTATGMIVKSASWAKRLRDKMEAAGRKVPQDVSMIVVGLDDLDPAPHDAADLPNAYLVSPEELVDAVLLCLKGAQSKRPISLWLATKRRAGNSIAPAAMSVLADGQSTLPAASARY